MNVLAACLLSLSLPLAPQKGKAEASKAFAGEWMTSVGPMELAAKSKAVTGTYGWDGRSKIEGKADKGRLEFEWSGATGRGEGWFELWDDGRTFDGEYVTSSGERGFWGGYKKEPQQAVPKAGVIVDGQSESGLEYHLRVPKGYDKKKKYVAIALLHGSNYNSRDYVEGFPGNWPELGERYILVGFDGEQLSSASRAPQRAFNATYVEFSGDHVGEPWRYNQTPWLLAQALDQLEQELPIERWLVGGHSQGGFLTLAMAMFYPEHIEGAFEVSGNLLVQCEPSFFKDEKIRAAQRRLPIAIVHGEKDDVVDFSAATYTNDTLQDGGFPMLRLFNAPQLGHPWAFLPVDEAVRWLDVLSGRDTEALLEFSEEAVKAERWRDASAGLGRLRELEKQPAALAKAEQLSAAIEAAAGAAAAPLEKAIAADKDSSWVDDFWTFRARFALTDAAKKTLDAYAKLRERQQKPAETRFYQARNESDERKRKELYQEIVDKYYASSFYRLVKGWL